MRIQDMEHNDYNASRNDEVEVALARRYGNSVNAFWLSREDNDYPFIIILVNREISSIHYFPLEGHPGFRPVGHAVLPAQGMTTFFMNSPREAEYMINASVVPFSTALAVAKEFLISTALPRSVEWFEL